MAESKFKVCIPHNAAISPPSTYLTETHKYAREAHIKMFVLIMFIRFKTTKNMIINRRVAK